MIMRVSEALKLAEQSMHSFKAGLDELTLKELVELTDNLRFTNNFEVFRTCHDVLVNKLRHFLRGIQGLKATKERGIDKLCNHIEEETGFKIGSKTSPSEGLKKHIDEIISWVK